MEPQYSNGNAYFHWPPVWFVNQPEDIDNSDMLNEGVYHRKLQNGIEIKIQRGGMVIFEFLESSKGYIAPSTPLPPNDEQMRKIKNTIHWRTELINAHLICLYSAIDIMQQGTHLKKMIVTPVSLFQYRDNYASSRHDNISVATTHFMNCQNAIPADFTWWREKRNLTIKRETIDRSFEILDTILQHEAEDALYLVRLYAQSCVAFEDHDFNFSLITAWVVIERLIQVFWNGYIEANRERPPGNTFINKKRKERLNDHRQYTVASIVEILSLTETIPLSLYNEINNVRKARNNWIHSLDPISEEQAQESIMLASQMLRLIYGIELRVSLGITLML